MEVRGAGDLGERDLGRYGAEHATGQRDIGRNPLEEMSGDGGHPLQDLTEGDEEALRFFTEPKNVCIARS